MDFLGGPGRFLKGEAADIGEMANEAKGLLAVRSVVVAVLAALFVVVLPLVPGAAAQGSSVVISEIYYNPPGSDEGDQFVELHNPTGAGVDVGGWRFGSGVELVFAAGTVIAPGDWFVVADDPGAFTTTFGVAPDAVFSGSLSNGGEELTLLSAAGELVDAVVYDDASPWPIEADGDGPSLQLVDVALDNADALSWGIGTPWPGAANSGVEAPATAAPVFEVGRGVYGSAVIERITSTTPGAVIHYTLNAQPPTESSPVWTNPTTISPTDQIQHLRAIAVAPGRAPSGEVSASYLFPGAFPFSAGFDQLGTVSLSYDSGQYESCGAAAGECPRNGISLDMIDPGKDGFGVTAGVAPFGTSSLAEPKNHLRFYFDSEWGPSDLEYPVFEDFGRGFVEPAETFDKLELKAQGWESVMTYYFRSPYYISDRFWKDTVLDKGTLHPHGRVVNVFINGDYHGVFDLRERFDANWISSYTDIPEDDYDSIRHDAIGHQLDRAFRKFKQ